MKLTKAFLFAASLLFAGSVFAADSAPVKEDRQKMIEMHSKMAECLKSDKSTDECHKDMKSSCSCKAHGGKAGGCAHHGKGKKGEGCSHESKESSTESK